MTTATKTRTPEPWQYAAAMRALSEVGWNCLTDEERAIIDKWEGRTA